MKDEDKPERKELADVKKRLANLIKQNKNIDKVKNYRNKKLGHKNKQLVLDDLLETRFRKANNLDIEDIESSIHLLADALKKISERAGFHILTIPITPIRSEIRDLFDRLSQDKSEF
jgi:hypothetical protein